VPAQITARIDAARQRAIGTHASDHVCEVGHRAGPPEVAFGSDRADGTGTSRFDTDCESCDRLCCYGAVGRSGVRCEWVDVPFHIRAEVERILGASIVAARNIDGGFSPGPAARCDLDDGRVVFIKAAGKALNPISPAMHRREAEVLAVLPTKLPAPRLIGVADDGDWIAIVTTWIDGTTPAAPLSETAVSRVLRVADRLAERGYGVGVDALEPAAVVHANLAGHWRHVIDEPVAGLDSWTSAHLGDLASLESDFASVVEGEHVVHFDLRIDNIVLGVTEDDDVVVDWPNACIGAGWIDIVAMLPSLHLDGGPEPEEALKRSAVASAADPAAVDVFLASIAGYFTRISLLPPPPGLPTVRQFQAAQGDIARTWLRQRLDAN
jgi:hypothetical protein